MSNRRRRPRKKAANGKFLDSEFARPVFALLGIAALWIAFKIGLIDAVARRIIEPLRPKETNAGDIYKRAMERQKSIHPD